jgi:hypothetical protein
MVTRKIFREYLSLILLFAPPVLFSILLLCFRQILNIAPAFPYIQWQLVVIAIAGSIATIGGVLDWKYHRDPLNMKIPKKERDAETAALGLGGLPMFILMWLAMMSADPILYLLPILIVLIYTVSAICYDEFVFHRKRCGARENLYHRMLVFGNGIAWLAWMHLIYYK